MTSEIGREIQHAIMHEELAEPARYAVMVTLDEPQAVQGTYGYATAGWNAAPTFAAITKRLAPVFGVMPVEEPVALAAFESGRAPDARRASLDAPVAGGTP